MPNDRLNSDAGTPAPDEALARPAGAPKISAGLGASRKPAIIAGVAALVILIVLIAFGVLLFNNPTATATLRDIFIILLGVEMMVIGLLMAVLLIALVYVALKLYDLTQFVENELRPMLDRADDAIRAVHSRTVFITDTAVKPVIEVMSYLSAVRSVLRAFTRRRD